MTSLISEKTLITIKSPLLLKSGVELPSFVLVYEFYGKLNDSKSNAILICPSIFTHHHVAGSYSGDPKNVGWWDHMVGPGKPIDTDRYFVIGLENIGGCHGSTGPSSVNPQTGSTYGASFPYVSVEDWVTSQSLLADNLGIKQFFAVVGCGYAGFQAIQWSLAFPERVRRVCVIAGGPNLSDRTIAIHSIARKAILIDRNFNWKNFSKYGETDVEGLQIAMMLENVEALASDKLDERFARELRQDKISYNVIGSEFQVESYLQYTSNSARYFNPSSYLLMSRAVDNYDAYELVNANSDDNTCQGNPEYLFVVFPDDQLFKAKRAAAFVDHIRGIGRTVDYCEVDSEFGNSSYLRTTQCNLENLIGEYFQEYGKSREQI